jgi:hypothetical protein
MTDDHVHEWKITTDQTDNACAVCACGKELSEEEINDRLNWYSQEFEQPSVTLEELPEVLAKLLAPTITEAMERCAKAIQEWNATVHEAGLELDNPKR